MRILHWITNREVKSEFEKVFSYLKGVGESNSGAKKTYELLAELDFGTSDDRCELLISEVNNIQYQSNTNSCFYFYFPIVSHILYYKPKFEKDILRYLVGPNFANGETKPNGVILLIRDAMEFKLSENKNYLTREGKSWTLNELPKMEKEVEREVKECWKELNE